MQKTLENYEVKSINKPEETRKFEKGKIELVNIGGVMVGRATFEPGWKWSTCVKPLSKAELCEAPHFAYHISGTLAVKMEDGTERLIKAGDFVNIPARHDAWVVGNEPVVAVDFQGMVDYAKKK